MTNSFLETVAQHLQEHTSDSLNTSVFVFPNHRAGLFFLKYLTQSKHHAFIAPQITTINQLFDQLSDIGVNNDRIDMLITLHQVYRDIMKSDIALDDFLFYGQMMLNDFDEIDEHLLDSKRVFVETANLKELDAAFTPNLTEQQKEAVKALFGDSGLTGDDDGMKSRFAEIWNHLAQIRDAFVAKLLADNKGVYKGLQHKYVIQNRLAENVDLWNRTFGSEQLVFVGFNALTKAEERLLLTAKDHNADFYWDYGFERLNDMQETLSRHNQKLFPSKYPIIRNLNAKPSIKLYGIASDIAQTKVAGWLLSEIAQNNETLEKTAVVLPNEQLLLPMLGSIKVQTEHINITMGYPMVATPVYALLDYLSQLQIKKRLVDGQEVFYHKDVEAILCHSYVKRWESIVQPQTQGESIYNDMIRLRRIYISPQELQKNRLFDLIFKTVGKEDFINYLVSILSLLQQTEAETTIDTEQNDAQIFLRQYIDMLERLQVTFGGQSPLELQGLVRLIKQLSASETISFRGEPLHGLQIMGALEARALDFDNLIILSANEGMFPKSPGKNTYLPYRVRKAYELPTHELDDCIESYNFYRLLTHARNVSLIYDTRPDGERKGEVSRFVMQLKYKYNEDIKEFQIQTDAQTISPVSERIEIGKTPEMLQKIQQIPPSAIKDYLHCPLQFYLKRVVHINEEKKLDDSIQANVFGNIVHKALEQIYKSLVKKNASHLITAKQLGELLNSQSFAPFVESAFRQEYLKSDREITGQDSIIFSVVTRYVRQILERDRDYTPFWFVGAEYKFKGMVGGVVNGIIDRIDLKQTPDGKWVMRVIDYKTGKENLKISGIPQMLSRQTDTAYNAMQVCIYCLVVEQILKTESPAFDAFELKSIENLDVKNIEIQPHLFFVRTSCSDDIFSTALSISVNKTTKPFVWADESEEFSKLLNETINEIFDLKTPFAQTKYEKQCKYCPFGDTCNRETIPKWS